MPVFLSQFEHCPTQVCIPSACSPNPTSVPSFTRSPSPCLSSRLILNSMTGESWARSKRYGCHEEALESYRRRAFEEENGYPQTSWSPGGAGSRRTECGRVEGPAVLPLGPTAALYLPAGSGAFVVGLEVASHLCSVSDGGQCGYVVNPVAFATR